MFLPKTPPKFEMKGHKANITSLAFHPSYTQVATTSEDGSIKIWQFETGDFERTLKGHTSTPFPMQILSTTQPSTTKENTQLHVHLTLPSNYGTPITTINVLKLCLGIITTYRMWCSTLREIWCFLVLGIRLSRCGKLALGTARGLGRDMRLGLGGQLCPKMGRLLLVVPMTSLLSSGMCQNRPLFSDFSHMTMLSKPFC